jgi:hypothetical protein
VRSEEYGVRNSRAGRYKVQGPESADPLGELA